MGTWGTAIFSDDDACDVRSAFRELIAAGRSPGQATQEIIDGFGLAQPKEPEDGPAWMGLAVAQWKLGRLVDEVRDAALRAIETELAEPMFEGADRGRRQAVLLKTRDQLNSPPPPARRVRAERVAQSPFSPGDVVAYTTASGRRVALWAMFNKRHEGFVTVSVDTAFRLQALGDPELPPLDEMLKPPAGRIHQFFLDQPQDTGGPSWEVIANVPFPDPDRFRDGPFTVLPVKGTRRPTLDEVFESWFEELRAADPTINAMQPFVDLMPDLSADRRLARDAGDADAQAVAIALATVIDRGDENRGAKALDVVERYLDSQDPLQRRIGIEVLDGVLNAASHPEVAFDRRDLQQRLGPASRRIAARLDEAWEAIAAQSWRPPELRSEAEQDELGGLFASGIQWMARVHNRDLGDGTYRITFSYPGMYPYFDAPLESVTVPAPAATIA